MAQYRAKGPDGKMYKFSGPPGLSDKDASFFLDQYINLGGLEEPAPVQQEPKPQAEMGFIPSVKRGALGLQSLLADVAPAMVAKGLGYDEYAARQMEEAAATQKEIQEKYPAEVASFKDIDSPGKALTYIKEAIGEALPSILPSIFTGGAAGIAGRGATQAAMQAAEQAAKRELMKDAAQAAIRSGAYGAQKETLDAVRQVALKAGLDAARKTALKYEAAGALAGSAAQNVPDVYQNVYEAGGTERGDLLPALVGGAFNSVLDAITPLNILRKAKISGIPEQQIIGAWYKRAGKGAVEGMVTEGGTEALQEMSSAAAERFVNENKQFFTPENFTRFIDAGLKGGFGGAGITSASNVLFGRAEPEQRKGVQPGAMPSAPTLTPEQEQAAREAGITLPTAPQAFEITPEVTPEGEADVGQTDTTAGGAGPVVSEPASAVVPAPGGVEPSTAAGVVPAGENVAVTPVGEGEQPAPVAQAPATAPTEVVDEEKITRPTPAAIATGMKFDEAAVGNLYNEERTLSTDTVDEKGNRVKLPEWNKLTRDQKDLYLGYIVNNTGEEHDAARKALVKYRAELREASRIDAKPEIDVLNELDPKDFKNEEEYQAAEAERKAKLDRLYRSISDIKADPAAAAYTFNRGAQGTMEGWSFPEWSALTTEQRGIFTDELARVLGKRQDEKGNPITDLNQATGEELDQAFRKLGESMVAEAQAKEAAARATEEKNRAARQAEIEKETERKKAEEEKRRRDAHNERIGKARFVPDHVIKQLMKGNFAAVLEYLRTAATQKIHRAIAQRIHALKLQTKIKMVDELPEGRLAEYDPKTDTILVTAEGLKDEILLHEVAHAATVSVLNRYFEKYLKGEKYGLTQEQLDAVEHLQDLMEYARPFLENSYPAAFENLYEFTSYGLSNVPFQDALNALPMQSFTDTILPENKSGWSEFVAGIVKLFNWGKALFTPSGKVKRQAGLVEFLAAAEQVMEAPTGGIKMAPLPATVQAPPLTAQQQTLQAALEAALQQVSLKEHGGKRFLQNLFTKRGAEWLVTTFQNERYPLKVAEDRARRFGILHRIGEKMNNIYGQVTRAAGIAVNLFETRVKNATDEVHNAVEEYAKIAGIDVKDALPRLHLILEALHEPERRMVKYLLNVPLDSDTKFSVKGINQPAMSAEGWRSYIMRELAQAERPVDAKMLRKLLDQIALDPRFHSKVIFDKNGKVLNLKPEQYADYFDPNSPKYNVIAERTPAELNAFLTGLVPGTDLRTRTLPNTPEGQAVQRVIDGLNKVKEATQELNKEANYYSTPVDNIIKFYDFKNYVPFKGKPGKELIDEEFNIESRYVGGEMQEGQDAFEGRISESENPLLQILADGATASLRAGRKDLMKSIENAINDKILKGDVKADTIKFEDRYLKRVELKDLKGPNKIFLYQPDGSIKIAEIFDPKQREALRRSYRMSNPILDYANMATSALGMMHTRYNPAFAPMNFVRDALTNAFTLGAELGPEKAGRLLTAIASDVSSGGMKKALQFAQLHKHGQFDKIDELAKKDQYFQDMKDYVAMGGKVSYLQGVAAKGALDELIKEVGRGGVMKTKDQVDKFVDIWNEMFELSSRTAAYRMLRDEFYAENKKKGMSDADAMADAQSHAVEYAKNLANFEQVGRWGKGMGALFMFFRPAATGAVRAIESLAPAFRLLPPGMGGFDEAAFREAAQAEKRTPEQIDKAVAEMKQEAQHAARMSFALLGVGATVYLMALLMAGDDDAGRNKVATDDMARWTRYARFHIPGTDFIFQIPWGFGLGAFASAGAQMASMLSGRQSFGDVAANIMDVGMDSFLPLPISRISVVDNPAAKVMDTVTPSIMRPFFEYVMNLDGLGREIYNNRQTRYGDAFTGGDNIPEMYKSAARWLFNATDGAMDWSPNTMYFFANNYADGLAKVAAAGTDTLMLASGQKAFDEGALKSMPFISSFIGSKSNYDAREFSKFENRVKAMDKRMEALKNQPEKFIAYIEANPQDYALVDVYNKQVNGALRQLRASANQIRANPELTPRERKEQLKDIVDMQNMVKRNMLEVFKQIEESY